MTSVLLYRLFSLPNHPKGANAFAETIHPADRRPIPILNPQALRRGSWWHVLTAFCLEISPVLQRGGRLIGSCAKTEFLHVDAYLSLHVAKRMLIVWKMSWFWEDYDGVFYVNMCVMSKVVMCWGCDVPDYNVWYFWCCIIDEVWRNCTCNLMIPSCLSNGIY